MSDASKDIAAQFAAAGVVPGQLVPQGGVAKAYVDAQDAALQAGINAVSTSAGTANQIANQANTTAGQANAAAAAAQTRAEQAFTEAHSAFGISEQALTQAQKNISPSFNRINEIEATDIKTKLNIASGPGISVSTNADTKTLTITATGQSTPGPHAISHLPGGSDPIPTANSTTSGLQSFDNVKTVEELYNPPRAQYSSNVDKNIPSVTWTSPSWNLKTLDSDSIIDQADNGTIKINTSGFYLIIALVTLSGNTEGQRNLRILRNGDTAIPVAYVSNRAALTAHRLMISGAGYFNAGEKIVVQAYQDSPAVLTFVNGAGSALSVISMAPP